MLPFFCRQKNISEKFLLAVRKGDSVCVREYLSIDTSQTLLQTIDGQGRNALMLVCSKYKPINHELVANIIFEHIHVFDLNQKDHHGNTALNLAATHKIKALFQVLWTNPAVDINLSNNRSIAPSLCHTLLSPKLLACRKNDIDLTVKDAEGKSLFFLAIEHGRLDLVKALIEYCPDKINVNETDIHGNNALMSMIQHERFLEYDHVEIVNLLLMKELDRSYKNSQGHTLEHILLHKKYKYTVQGPADDSPDITANYLKDHILRIMFGGDDAQSLLTNKCL